MGAAFEAIVSSARSAMTPAIRRPLQLWEQIGFSMNVSMYLELQGHGVDTAMLTRAFKSLQAEHPFLRMGIETQEEMAIFAEQPNPALELITTAGFIPGWQPKLQEFANEFRDWSAAVAYMELASDGDQHQLFLTINHAGACWILGCYCLYLSAPSRPSV